MGDVMVAVKVIAWLFVSLLAMSLAALLTSAGFMLWLAGRAGAL